MKHTTDSLDRDRLHHGETNDCTVRAMAATTGLPYAIVHTALKLHGRRNGRGADVFKWGPALKDLGFKISHISTPGRTIRTAVRYLPRGRKFILKVKGHVAGFDGERILDWAEGRQHRIMKVYEVIRCSESDIRTIVIKKGTEHRKFSDIDPNYVMLTPPPRVNRMKWIKAHNLTAGRLGVVELTGDAAVAHRKSTGLRGKVYTLFG